MSNAETLNGSLREPRDVLSAFVTPTDSYTNLYIEGGSPQSVSHFLRQHFYHFQTLQIVPLEQREAILTIHQREPVWVSLSDNTLGYVLGPDTTASQQRYLVALPPSLPDPAHPQSNIRRLFGFEDIKKIMGRSFTDRFMLGPFRTFEIHTKQGGLRRFCGPLTVSSLEQKSFKAVHHPNPFHLRLFLESLSHWSSLYADICKEKKWDTREIPPFTTFGFLTQEEMARLGRLYGVAQLEVNDFVSIAHSSSVVPQGTVGKVFSIQDPTLKVSFPTMEEVVLLPFADVVPHFEYAQHVQVVCGQCTGTQGNVAYSDENTVSILAADSAKIVSISFSLCFLLLTRILDHRSYFLCASQARLSW